MRIRILLAAFAAVAVTGGTTALMAAPAMASSTNTLADGPSVSSFSPADGAPGASVTITGSGFTGASAVTFNGVAASSFTVNSDTQITATVPSGTTNGVVKVTTPGGTAASSSAFWVDNVTDSGLNVSEVDSGDYHVQANEYDSSAAFEIAGDGNPISALSIPPSIT